MTKLPAKQELAQAMEKATPEQGVELIAGLSGLDAFNLILEHPTPEAVVKLIPMESLYLMVHELGSQDAMILLELASPEQVQGFIDLDCWDRDRLDLPKARTWFLLLNELDDGAFISHIKEIDLALLVIFFREHLNLHRIDNLDDELPEGAMYVATPDGRHLIEYICSVEQSRIINALLMRIYRLDLDFFLYLLEALYWEGGADTEETAYNQRMWRLELLGFPDYYNSLEILAVVDVDRFAPPRKVAPAPRAKQPGAKVAGSQYLVKFEHPVSMLRQVLAEEFNGRDQILMEIMTVANMAMMAARVSFVDIEKVRHMVRRTDGYLNIGLQRLAGTNLAAAREVLLTYRMTDLHKIGRSLVVREARRAKALLPGLAVDGRSPEQLMLDGPERDLVFGLVQSEPVRHQAGKDEPWTELDEVKRAAATINALERLMKLLEENFQITPQKIGDLYLQRTNYANAAELTFRVLTNTFRAHDLLGHPPQLTPLTEEEVRELTAKMGMKKKKMVWPQDKLSEFNEWLGTLAGKEAKPLIEIFSRYINALVTELTHRNLEHKLRSELLVSV